MFKSILTSIAVTILSILGISVHTPVAQIPLQPAPPLATSTQPITTTTITKVTLKNTQKPVVAKKIATTTQVAQPLITSAPTPVQTEPQIPFETLNVLTRKALVNILCTVQTAGPVSPITGSGVVISDNGVILTNAHIGQYWLLKNFNGQKDFVQCVIRTGSPAYPTYTAELLYISPSWVTANKTLLLEQNPLGTGEHDYAFLRITGKVDNSALPTSIPFVPVSTTEDNTVGMYTLLDAYPAGFLGGQSIIQGLDQTTAITTIADVFTYGKNTVDLISVPGTVVSQKGSSGGAVVSGNGKVVGIITTESESTQTSQRDLRAITTAYINRDMQSESSLTITDLITHPAEYAKNFNANIAPTLTDILTNAILKK